MACDWDCSGRWERNMGVHGGAETIYRHQCEDCAHGCAVSYGSTHQAHSPRCTNLLVGVESRTAPEPPSVKSGLAHLPPRPPPNLVHRESIQSPPADPAVMETALGKNVAESDTCLSVDGQQHRVKSSQVISAALAAVTGTGLHDLT